MQVKILSAPSFGFFLTSRSQVSLMLTLLLVLSGWIKRIPVHQSPTQIAYFLPKFSPKIVWASMERSVRIVIKLGEIVSSIQSSSAFKFHRGRIYILYFRVSAEHVCRSNRLIPLVFNYSGSLNLGNSQLLEAIVYIRPHHTKCWPFTGVKINYYGCIKVNSVERRWKLYAIYHPHLYVSQ